MAGVALLALGWLWWHAWFAFDAVVAAAVGVAGVALGDSDFHFAWQAWRLVTSTFTLHGGRGAWRHRRALEWLWCAVTRCSDFNNVGFFKHEKADEEMPKNLVITYFKNKVEGYRMQDRKIQRGVDDENYIDDQWCLKHFCGNCGMKFNLETRGGKMSSNFTAQRIDRALGHSINSCAARCCCCNSSAH